MTIDEEILEMQLNHKAPMSHQEFMRRGCIQDDYRNWHAKNGTLTVEVMRQLSERFKSDLKEYDYWKLNRPPEIYEQVHKYPAKWECPKCGTGLTKDALKWNFLLEENVCGRCGKPQSQHATGEWKEGMKPTI